jgi:hypothetical protein
MTSLWENLINKDGFYITEVIKGTTFVDSGTSTAPSLAEQCGVFFIAHKPMQIIAVKTVHDSVGTGTLNLERLSGTEALDSGDTIFVANVDLSGAANTVTTKEGSALQNTQLLPGERLAVKDGGTLTDTQSICITLYCKPLGKGDYR